MTRLKPYIPREPEQLAAELMECERFWDELLHDELSRAARVSAAYTRFAAWMRTALLVLAAALSGYAFGYAAMWVWEAWR